MTRRRWYWIAADVGFYTLVAVALFCLAVAAVLTATGS